MTNPIVRGLQAVGLAPIGHLYEMRARASEADLLVRELRSKIEHLSRELATGREDSERARTEAETAERKRAEARHGAESRLQDARDAARQWKEKADALLVQFRDLRGRVSDAERVEAQLRELLMVNETKLDLVEAAINVLDLRTRREAGRGA